MEIRQRIESCLTDLESKRRTLVAYRERVRTLIDTLKAEGSTPGTLGEMLVVLETVLHNYEEISESCARMAGGLLEIGQHLDRVEEGRRKILNGVEAILANLSKLDEIAGRGQVLGPRGASQAGDKARPKRVLLIRIRPEAGEAASPLQESAPELDEEADPGEDGEPLVH